MSAALCWMLQAWMPPLWAFLGTLVGVAQVGVTGYWMDSYWGGAATAAAGCLVLGAVPRLARAPSAAGACWGSVGLAMLANARPFEGLCTALAAGIVLVYWRLSVRKPAGALLSLPVVTPFVAIGLLGGMWMAFYNYSVTGHMLELPYTLNNRQYSVIPQFYVLPERPRPWPVYNHEIIRQYWEVWCRNKWLRSRQNPLEIVPGFLGNMSFFYSFWFAALIAASVTTFKSQKVRMAGAIVALTLLALLLEVGIQPHYFAPAVGALVILAAYGLRWLHARTRRYGSALVILLVMLVWKRNVTAILDAARDHRLARLPNLNLYAADLVRSQVFHRLAALGSRHLVIVRYDSRHDVGKDFEVVYNHADIDSSNVIWARDMGTAKNQTLIDYYRDRRCWLLNPDTKPWSLSPYSH